MGGRVGCWWVGRERGREGGQGRGWAYQSAERYSLALVRVRVSRAGAAWMVLAAMERARARASLVMEKGIVIGYGGFCRFEGGF